MRERTYLNLISFLAAFLLFQLEFIIAKILLPNYGGTYMVWGASMVFFQFVLFAGYVFVYAATVRLKMVDYRWIHLFIILFPLLFFPGRPLSSAIGEHGTFLAWDVFKQLFVTIGPVFFALSTISITTQAWLLNSELKIYNPYSLYAWSNLGSLLALLTYPFVFEFFYTLSEQLLFWKILYVVFIFLNLVAFVKIRLSPTQELAKFSLNLSEERAKQIGVWLCLSAGGVMMFLAVTNILTIEIAPIPLLWMIPLGLFLGSFILNFKEKSWCPQWMKTTIAEQMGLSLLIYFLLFHRSLPVAVQLLVVLILLGPFLMYCQARLYELRPTSTTDLPLFYLILAFGGLGGGVLTVWVIPLISDQLLEYIVALFVVSLTLNAQNSSPRKWGSIGLGLLTLLVLFLWPMAFHQYHFWGILAIGLFLVFIFRVLTRTQYLITLVLGLVIVLASFYEIVWTKSKSVFLHRNFYGINQVIDYSKARVLFHGTTKHGAQKWGNMPLDVTPISYYGQHSPLWDIFTEQKNFQLKRIGVIGLGAGTIASYSQSGQEMDFYELDREVFYIAKKYFSFLDQAKGDIQVVIGDGRMSLDRLKDRKYDVLVIDAFGGDAVPSHLLTQEMFEKYRYHLNSRGLILLNASNRLIKIGKIPARISHQLNAKLCYKWGTHIDDYETISLWVALTWDPQTFNILTQDLGWGIEDPKTYMQIRPWTDEYSNILQIIKYDFLWDSLRTFNPFSW